MTCAEAELHLLAHHRGTLQPDAEEAIVAHLASCPACAKADHDERALSAVLDEDLPQYPASFALKHRLARLVDLRAPPSPARRFSSSAARWAVPAIAAGLVAASAGVLTWGWTSGRRSELALLTSEAVSDHLRVLSRERRVEIESGGPHQVKPWFQGRLDFAPDVPELPPMTLQGGSVGYFRERKAAVLTYALRLHAVTLLEVPAEGLAWPFAPGELRSADDRRFHAFFWRSGELGYALVSDADAAELGTLARGLAARR